VRALRTPLLLGIILVVTAAAADAAVPAAPPSPPGAAVLELTDVAHALQDRTLVVTGWVRNTGRVPASGLVIDASGYSPAGDLAAFGSDGIPWALRPQTAERFQIPLLLGNTLVSAYTVTISASQPRQARPAAVNRTIFPAFYRSLILSRVQVDVETEPLGLTLTASADGLPVSSVLVTINFLVREKQDLVLRVLTVDVPIGRPLRLRFAPVPVRVVSVTVVDVTLATFWAVP
jgi:hypothetical protein